MLVYYFKGMKSRQRCEFISINICLNLKNLIVDGLFDVKKVDSSCYICFFGGWASILACAHQKNHITEELIADLMEGNFYFKFEA